MRIIDKRSGKVKCGSKAILCGSPVVLIGVNVKNRPTYNVVGNFGVMQISSPFTIYISIARDHYTTQGIKENNSFSVNIPSADLVQPTDYCGIVSGHQVDKSTVFQSFYGVLGSVPMILECPINFECKVIRHISNFSPDGDIFFAEVVEAYIGEQYLSDSNTNQCEVDIKKVNPIYIASDRYYWILGNPIAKAFDVGKRFRE